MQDAKNRQKVAICAPSYNFVALYLATKACIDNRKKNLLSSNTFFTCSGNMVNFGPLTAEIDPVVCGTPANFNGFCILTALLHGSQVLGVNQTLRRSTEGATYIWQGGHHVGHWPTFLVCFCFPPLLFCPAFFIPAFLHLLSCLTFLVPAFLVDSLIVFFSLGLNEDCKLGSFTLQ